MKNQNARTLFLFAAGLVLFLPFFASAQPDASPPSGNVDAEFNSVTAGDLPAPIHATPEAVYGYSTTGHGVFGEATGTGYGGYFLSAANAIYSLNTITGVTALLADSVGNGLFTNGNVQTYGDLLVRGDVYDDTAGELNLTDIHGILINNVLRFDIGGNISNDSGMVRLDDDVEVTGDVQMLQNLIVADDLTAGQDLNVGGDGVVTGELTVWDELLPRSGMNVLGDVDIQGDLDLIGRLSIVPTSGHALQLERISGQPNIKAAANEYMIIDSDNQYLSLNHYENDNVILGAGGGSVGIGKTVPSARLDVNGQIRGTSIGRFYHSGWGSVNTIPAGSYGSTTQSCSSGDIATGCLAWSYSNRQMMVTEQSVGWFNSGTCSVHWWNASPWATNAQAGAVCFSPGG